MADFEIGSEPLTLNIIRKILSPPQRIALSETAKDKIVQCRRYLDEKMSEPGKLYYGINTGFGALHNIQIPLEQINQLQ